MEAIKLYISEFQSVENSIMMVKSCSAKLADFGHPGTLELTGFTAKRNDGLHFLTVEVDSADTALELGRFMAEWSAGMWSEYGNTIGEQQ
ncbi:hypothetical protein [Cerasicoccus frondis]|uniref:hypothetical protein n=1 Tax=Cerasicoccus frondis TaxID=490090 RepID=UPI002852B3DD|nr:hypothetical protein [Cerasicoccus frondis]